MQCFCSPLDCQGWRLCEALEGGLNAILRDIRRGLQRCYNLGQVFKATLSYEYRLHLSPPLSTRSAVVAAQVTLAAAYVGQVCPGLYSSLAEEASVTSGTVRQR